MDREDAGLLVLDGLLARPEWAKEHRNQIKPEMFEPPWMTRAVRAALYVMDCRGKVQARSFISYAVHREGVRPAELDGLVAEACLMDVFGDDMLTLALHRLRDPWRRREIEKGVEAALKQEPAEAVLRALDRVVAKWNGSVLPRLAERLPEPGHEGRQ